MSANPKLQDWRGRVVWIIGASSGIGRATAARLHQQGAQVLVSARSAEALAQFCQTHAGAEALPLDVSDPDSLQQAWTRLMARAGQVDLVLYCAGHYEALDVAHYRLEPMLRHLEINYVGALRVLEPLLPQLLRQGCGHLSLVASVAGYRGLPQALAYGPSKAAMQHLAEILFLELQPRGIGVSVINPGFVETPLTAQNRFRMPALISPEEAAEHILRGWAQGHFDIHFPRRFTNWLKLLQLLPHRLYVGAVRRTTGL